MTHALGREAISSYRPPQAPLLPESAITNILAFGGIVNVSSEKRSAVLSCIKKQRLEQVGFIVRTVYQEGSLHFDHLSTPPDRSLHAFRVTLSTIRSVLIQFLMTLPSDSVNELSPYLDHLPEDHFLFRLLLLLKLHKQAVSILEAPLTEETTPTLFHLISDIYLQGRDYKGALELSEKLPPGVWRSSIYHTFIDDCLSRGYLIRAEERLEVITEAKVKDEARRKIACAWLDQNNRQHALSVAYTIMNRDLQTAVLLKIFHDLLTSQEWDQAHVVASTIPIEATKEMALELLSGKSRGPQLFHFSLFWLIS